MKWLRVAALAAGMATAACSTSTFLWQYRTTIEQGNLIDIKDLAKVELGMSGEQVRFLLGTPLLTDPLNAGRWDYLYWNCSGDSRLVKTQLSLYFDDDRLARAAPPLEVAQRKLDLSAVASDCR